MRAMIFALMLMTGCAGTMPGAEEPEAPRDEIVDTLNFVRVLVSTTAPLADLACAREGQQSDVCTTVRHSLSAVEFARVNAQQLYDTYKATGAGKELVLQAVDTVFAAIDALNGNAVLAKRFVDGSTHASAVAVGPKPGVGVAEPPAGNAGGVASPGSQPAPAKAPR